MTPHHPVRIVLVEPSHPGNIGAVARAMKNMGLTELWLVAPRQFPHAEATALAAGAADLLVGARVVDTVEQALTGCGWVLGTTARVRTQYPWPILAAREAALRATGEAAVAPVALLFGPERTGLTNDHLALCHALVQIPCNPDYSSLNLAQAVLLLAYELRMAAGATLLLPERESPLPAVESVEHLYTHLERVMQRAAFDTHGQPEHVSRRLRRLLHRAVPDTQELNLLRGFLGAVETALPATPSLAAPSPEAAGYFDHAATTPLRSVARTALLAALDGTRRDDDPVAEGVTGNPTTPAHLPGRRAAARLLAARTQLAACVGAVPEALVFTSGATEADNLAILGAARGAKTRGRHVLTAKTEHRAVLDACAQLSREGFEVQYLEPDASGRVAAAVVASALRADTVLVSLMLVNNETGVVQDLAGIASVCRPRGVLLHTDAAQALGKVPVDVIQLGVDLLSLSAHKCGGPVGVGALYVRRLPRPVLEPLLYGGGQEAGLRPGTPPVALAAAFAAAAVEAVAQLLAAGAHFAALGEQLQAALAGVSGWQLNAAAAPRSPAILSFTFDDIDGESLLLAMEPFAVASGAACSSVSREPSAVLRALGHDDARAEATLRVSLGWTTTAAQVAALGEHLCRVVLRLRGLDHPEPGAPRDPLLARAVLAEAAAAPPGAYSRRLRHWVAMPLRAWLDSPLPGPCCEAGATDAGSRTAVTFRAGSDGHGGTRVRWRARGCPHVLGACEVMAETLERELVARARDPMLGSTATDLRLFAAAVDAPTEKLSKLLVVIEAAAALRSRYTAP